MASVGDLQRTEHDSAERSRLLLERASTWLAAIALFAVGWRYMDLLGDTFWSVATGRYILEHHALPTRDPFTFTADRPWIVHMPLSQIVLAWVMERFGALALELFGAVVFGASLVTLWLPHARGAFARFAVYPLLLLLVFVQATDLCVRGQLFGDLSFALLLVCMFRLRAGGRVHPASVVLFGALWINCHASAFLCVVVPLAWAAALHLEASSTRPQLAPYLEFAGAAALGLLLNPYGWRLVVDLLELLVASSKQVDLFQPPDFGSPLVLLSFALLVVGAAWCALRPMPRVGAAVPEALLAVAFGAAAASGRRYLPLALAYAMVLLARRVSALGRATPGIVPQLAFVVVAMLAAFWGLAADKDPWQNVPLEEARLVELLRLPDRVAQNYHWGGYLDYAWHERRKVFIDGRNQLFEGGALVDHERLVRLDGWREVLDRNRINTVIWERGAPLERALTASAEWRVLRRGHIAALFVRKQPLPLDTRSTPR